MITEYLDINSWKEVQDKFSKMLDLTLITLDNKGNEVLVSGEYPLFYQIIYNNNYGKKRIFDERKVNVNKLEKGNVTFFESFTGLMEIIIPIFIENKKIGAVVAPSIMHKRLDIDECKDISNKINVQTIDLMNAAYKMRLRDKNSIEIYGKMLYTLIDAVPGILKDKKEKEIQISELETLNTLSKVINSTLDFAEVLKLVRHYMMQIMQSEACSIILDDEKLYFDSSDKFSSADLRLEKKLYNLAKNNKEIIVATDVNTDERFEKGVYNFKSRLSIPLNAKDRWFGVINLAGNSLNVTKRDLEFLQIVANQVAMAIDNTLLHEHIRMKSVTDELTGAYNRRYFNDVLLKECKRADRNLTALSLIMFDVDHFKSFNDSFGHLAGDKVLKDVVKVAVSNIRTDVDMVCRYGGEEFIIILPGSHITSAVHVAERIRKGIENLYDTSLGDYKKVSSSFGVVEYYKNEDGSLFVKRVDELLYKSKETGRNKVSSDLEKKEK